METENLRLFNSITQFQLAVEWISKCENSDSVDTYEDFLKYRTEGQITSLFSPGLVIAYAYMCFMLPKQSLFDGMDFNSVDISKFKIAVDTYATKGQVCRHLRNALAHSDVKILECGMEFQDNNAKKNEKFVAYIDFTDLGRFISEIYYKNKFNFFVKDVGE